MRTEKEIRDDIEKYRHEYRSQMNTKSHKELAPFNKKVNELRKELSSTLADGAKICPKCKEKRKEDVKPVGMLKSVKEIDGVEIRVYEVGCPLCDLRSRAQTPQAAVAKWDKDAYIK